MLLHLACSAFTPKPRPLILVQQSRDALFPCTVSPSVYFHLSCVPENLLRYPGAIAEIYHPRPDIIKCVIALLPLEWRRCILHPPYVRTVLLGKEAFVKTYNHFIYKNPKRPPIDRCRVTLSRDYLWRNVFYTATKSVKIQTFLNQ